MRKLTVIIAACFMVHVQVGLAQDVQVTKSDSTAKIEGEVYIIHTVEPKQTLFSIAKTYEVKLSRIAFDNPGVLDGLKLGQFLKILQSAVGETREENKEPEKLELDGEYVLYTVPPRQTLYAISKEYNTTIAAIVDANPELSEGLKVGSIIRIPTPKIFGGEKVEGEKKEMKLQMVGLPDIIKKETSVMKDPGLIPTTGNITLLLPLYLEINDTLAAARLPEEDEKVFERSEIALQFYEGFLLAMDSLKSVGFNVNVKVIDTENRPWLVQKLIGKGELKNTDLIIGPLYSQVFKEVADYAYQNCIPVVSPTIKGDNILSGNPYVFRLIPSDETMITEMGRYLALSDSTQNMILHYNAADELAMIVRFRKGLETAGVNAAKFPAYNIYTVGSDSIRNRLSLTKRNNVVILSNNQVKLAGLTRRLSDWTEEAYIVGYAPNSWQGYKNLEVDHFDDLRIHMPVPFHVDYDRLEVQYFVQKFREKFNAEPSTFAFRGYDIAMHFIKNLSGIREDGPEYMESVEETRLQSVFGWKRIPDGGFENTRAWIVDYTGLEMKLAQD
ncbi:MAG: ABC transporter substrate-binding protein [Flavobacteriales bacterium]|nr:ABC transporter substrate-binding protein [Flavobacteriales bacterium]